MARRSQARPTASCCVESQVSSSGLGGPAGAGAWASPVGAPSATASAISKTGLFRMRPVPTTRLWLIPPSRAVFARKKSEKTTKNSLVKADLGGHQLESTGRALYADAQAFTVGGYS